MKRLTLFSIIITIGVALGVNEDDYKRKAEVDLLRLLLRDIGKLSVDQEERTGEPLEQQSTFESRSLSYIVDKRDYLYDLEQDIEDDDNLSNDERERLLDSVDDLIVRSGGCRESRYTCPNSDRCLALRNMCDGTEDCIDGSDEDDQICSQFYDRVCPLTGRFHCILRNHRRVCLSRDKMCDGRSQCSDGSDESENNCASLPACDDDVYIRRRTGEARYETCTSSSQCVLAREWCDGSQDCQNNADEDDCADAQLRNEALNIHNALRVIHENTPLVTWNEEVAGRAQRWAEYLDENNIFQHSPGNSEYRQNSGENIYRSSSRSAHLTNAIIAFYKEERNYDYSTGSSTGGVIGHFTQVVWDNSITIGCGVSRVRSTVVVCQYSPPGNYIGTYTSHVHRPKPGLDPIAIADSLRIN